MFRTPRSRVAEVELVDARAAVADVVERADGLVGVGPGAGHDAGRRAGLARDRAVLADDVAARRRRLADLRGARVVASVPGGALALSSRPQNGRAGARPIAILARVAVLEPGRRVAAAAPRRALALHLAARVGVGLVFAFDGAARRDVLADPGAVAAGLVALMPIRIVGAVVVAANGSDESDENQLHFATHSGGAPRPEPVVARR